MGLDDHRDVAGPDRFAVERGVAASSAPMSLARSLPMCWRMSLIGMF